MGQMILTEVKMIGHAADQGDHIDRSNIAHMPERQSEDKEDFKDLMNNTNGRTN